MNCAGCNNPTWNCNCIDPEDRPVPPSPIVESIGHWGTVRSEPTPWRLSFPHGGDVIDFGEFEGNYPMTNGRYGRVSDEPGCSFAGDDEVHVCCQPGSAFLFENGQVDISGGPFTCLKLTGLKFRGEYREADFWNWGNNGPGAGHGVHHTISRPVFVLEQWKEEA